MRVKKRLIIVSIVSFIVISLLGTLLHFTYEISGKNIIVGVISAVNESVWEHLKILVMPMFIVAIYEYIILNDNRDNFFIALVSRIITGMLLIITIYYTYTTLIGKSIDGINITIFYISTFIAQVVWYLVISKKTISRELDIVSLVVSLIILMLFIVFTFVTPKLGLFKDNSNNTYGIFESI